LHKCEATFVKSENNTTFANHFKTDNFMEKSKLNLRIGVLASIVLVAALSRLLPHPNNVTPVGAMALFGGAYFVKRWQSLVMPFVALWLSDLVLNNVVYKAYNPNFTLISPHSYWSYGAFALMVALGWVLLKKVKVTNVVVASLIGSTLFFLVTNFGAWFADPFNMYPKGIEGLAASYTLGLPYFLNTVLGDLVWCGVLFGGFEWAKQQFPSVVLQKAV
jgi:hypothetical protein